MIINYKSKKGITLISMILTVIVLMIILGAIVYSSNSSFQMKKIESLYSDIDSLKDAISVYYVKNGTLPVYYSEYDIYGQKVGYKEIELSNADENTYLNIPKNDYDNLNSYYIVDITKLNNISLNNKNNIPEGIETGKYSPNLTEYMELPEMEKAQNKPELFKAIDKGMFIVNSKTHIVYYTKGITSDGVTYYTKNEEYSKIPTFSKTDKSSIEDQILDENKDVEIDSKDIITIVFYANGGVEAPSNLVKDRNPQNESEDSLLYNLSGGNAHIGCGEPVKTGSKFLGWSTNASALKPEFVYSSENQGGKPYIEYKLNEELSESKDIIFSQHSSDIIELYAVWAVNPDLTLYYYYPNSTGGLLPTNYGNIITRQGEAEEVSNYICVDIPSSGYEISWEWESGSEYEQQAQYVGRLQKDGETEINSSSEITGTFEIPYNESKVVYGTTEPGTIQIKGSFKNLQIQLSKVADPESEENVDELVGLELKNTEKIKTVKIFKTAQTKDLAGAEVAKWLTGEDGKMIIPQKPETYKALKIPTPDTSNKAIQSGDETAYNYADEHTSLYYLKYAVVYDTINDVSSTGNINYLYKAKKLGDVIEITSENMGLYPCFGARNYVVSYNYNGEIQGYIYYHESLQEAFNQINETKYNTITLLRNTNRESKFDIDDKVYIAHNNGGNSYDPTYSKECTFISDNINLEIVLDCSKYKMTRKERINLENQANLTIKADNSNYGINFDNNSQNEAIKLKNLSKVTAKNGVSITSNNGIVFGLDNSTTLNLHQCKISNTSAINPTAIYSESSTSFVCLGIGEVRIELNDENVVPDGDVIVSTELGLAVNTKGTIYWKSGILKTADYRNKNCYNDLNDDGTEKKVFARDNLELGKKQTPCLYFDDSENKVCARLGVRDWSFIDNDSGNQKTYYTACLQDAHDCVKLRSDIEYPVVFPNINWLNPRADSGIENSALITKGGIQIYFNKEKVSGKIYNTSKLTINADSEFSKRVVLSGLNCETTEGIFITDTYVTLLSCDIGVNSNIDQVNALNIKGGTVTVTRHNNKIYTIGSTPAIYNDNGRIKSSVGYHDSDKFDIYTTGSAKAIVNKGTNALIEFTTDEIGSLNIYSAESSNSEYIIQNNPNATIEFRNVNLESKNRLSNTNKIIQNQGNLSLNSCCAKSNNTNTSTNVFAILNDNGKMTLSGNSILEASNVVKNDNSDMLIYGNSVIKGKYRGINADDSSNVFMYSSMENNKKITNSQSQDCPIVEISEKTGKAIYLSNKSNFTMGTSESSSQDVNTNLPIIKSAGTGVQISNDCTFSYYDGVIFGKDNGSNVVSTNKDNAIRKTAKGNINLPANYAIKGVLNQTASIWGTNIQKLRKLTLTNDITYLDNWFSAYDTLNDAITDVNSNTNITKLTLKKDSTETKNISYTRSTNLQLDCNGKKIILDGCVINNKGSLSITDSIDNPNNSRITIESNNSPAGKSYIIRNENAGTLELNGYFTVSNNLEKVILNEGDLNVLGNVKLSSKIGIDNQSSKKLKIADNARVAGNNTGILNTNGNIEILGNSYVSGNGYGINSSGGTIQVGGNAIVRTSNGQAIKSEGNITITDNATITGVYSGVTSSNTITITCSNLSTTGPMVIATKDSYGTAVSGKKVIIGTNETNPQVTTNMPIIKSKAIGVTISDGGRLEFYDGIIYGGTQSINNAGSLNVPTGYNLTIKTDQSVEINEQDTSCEAAVLSK